MIFNVHILFRCTISNQTARRAINSSAGSDFVLGVYIFIVTKLAILFHLLNALGNALLGKVFAMSALMVFFYQRFIATSKEILCYSQETLHQLIILC